MRFILVRRPVGTPTLEQLENDLEGHTEPVAVILLNTTVTEEEMNTWVDQPL